MRYLLLSVLLVLSACAGTKAAYKEADGLYETAYVVTEHYSVLLREAGTLVNAVANEATRNRLRGARDRATPIVLQLGGLARAWQATRSAEDQAALEAALAEASIALADFNNIVKEVMGR